MKIVKTKLYNREYTQMNANTKSGCMVLINFASIRVYSRFIVQFSFVPTVNNTPTSSQMPSFVANAAVSARCSC